MQGCRDNVGLGSLVSSEIFSSHTGLRRLTCLEILIEYVDLRCLLRKKPDFLEYLLSNKVVDEIV